MSTIRYLPIDPQPPASTYLWCESVGLAIFSARPGAVTEWRYRCPHPPGSELDGQRVESVSVEQREGVWCWKIKLEPKGETP
jgi:hypothetical protein